MAHSMTLSELYTQQVLNNLAMFVQNPDALPFFAFPNQGTTSIQDTANIGNPGYSSGQFASSQFILNGSRQTTENWVLVPISDPAKLALMRCAYRQAISSCAGIDFTDADCPSCRKLRRDFHGPPDPEEPNPQANEELPCLDAPCWFRLCCKRHVPKGGSGTCVGCYGEVCLWVPPEGVHMLTKLTLQILDYAVNDAVQFAKRTKTVEIYVDKNGKVIDEKAPGARKIIATIPIDMPSEAVAKLDVYGDFLRRFPRGAAQRLLDRAGELGVEGDNLKSAEYWRKVPDSDFPETLRGPLHWIKEFGITPGDIPDDDALLRGPLFERKGSASAGLQPLQQRLDAAAGVTPR